MIKSVYNYPVSTLLDIESGVIYAIPRYQREYTWSRAQWDALFDDLLDNEANYFLGSSASTSPRMPCQYKAWNWWMVSNG